MGEGGEWSSVVFKEREETVEVCEGLEMEWETGATLTGRMVNSQPRESIETE